MRSRILIMLACLISNRLSAQYQPIDKASIVQFKIKNLGFNVTGSFSGLQGKINFDPAHPDDAVFDVTLDANTINTDNGMRDDHLRHESYFDVEHYPRIRLVSTKVIAHKGREYLFTGKLTIKKQTRDISFVFTETPVDSGCHFQGSFSINRRDFD